MADFIEEGFFAKHLARMRRLYSGRQDEFVEECNAILGRWLSVEKIDTGMQIVGRFKTEQSDVEFCKRAAKHMVDVQPLSLHFRNSKPVHGIIMGYTGVDKKARQKGFERLKEIFLEG